MYFRKVFWWSIVSVLWCDANFADPTDDKYRESVTLSVESKYVPGKHLHAGANGEKFAAFDACNSDDFACLSMASVDKLGLEAIKSLHQKLDDDANGNVDLSESNDVSLSLLSQRRLL